MIIRAKVMCLFITLLLPAGVFSLCAPLDMDNGLTGKLNSAVTVAQVIATSRGKLEGFFRGNCGCL